MNPQKSFLKIPPPSIPLTLPPKIFLITKYYFVCPKPHTKCVLSTWMYSMCMKHKPIPVFPTLPRSMATSNLAGNVRISLLCLLGLTPCPGSMKPVYKYTSPSPEPSVDYKPILELQDSGTLFPHILKIRPSPPQYF